MPVLLLTIHDWKTCYIDPSHDLAWNHYYQPCLVFLFCVIFFLATLQPCECTTQHLEVQMAQGSCSQDELTRRCCIHMTLGRPEVLHEHMNLLLSSLFLSLSLSRYKFVVMVTHFNYPLQVPLIYESGWNVDDILSILHIFLAMLQITYIFYYGPDYSSFYYVLHPLLFGSNVVLSVSKTICALQMVYLYCNKWY